MSKAVKQVATIALPIALSFVAPGIGTALGSTLAASTLSGIGGAVGGAVSGGVINKGGVKGALTGAAIGGVGGYLGGGGASELFGGTAVGDALGLSAPASAASKLATTGPIGAGTSATASAGENALLTRAASAANAPVVGGNVARSLGSTISANTPSLNTVGTLLTAGNALSTAGSYDAAKDAAQLQADAVDKAVQVNAPYNELGYSAAKQIQQIQSDPGGYVQNNPFYKSLADEAQQRLLANQASKGKLASGGTQDALQTSLLNLGTGLVQNQVSTLQNQVNSGQGVGATIGNLVTDKGAVQAGGEVGKANALTTGYQNQISTLLALQQLNKAQSYSPNAIYRG